jgi:hypothetical protein
VQRWPGNTRRGRVHGGVRMREDRDGGVADRRGLRTSEGGTTMGGQLLTGRSHGTTRDRTRARMSLAPTGLAHRAAGGREGESARARTRAVAGRWGPPVRRCERKCARPGWAELGRLG